MLTRKVGPEGIRRPRRVPRAWFALAALGSGGVPAAQEPVFPPGFEAVQLPGFSIRKIVPSGAKVKPTATS